MCNYFFFVGETWAHCSCSFWSGPGLEGEDGFGNTGVLEVGKGVKDKLVRTDLTILPLNRGWAGCAGGGERTLVGAAAGSAGRAGRES